MLETILPAFPSSSPVLRDFSSLPNNESSLCVSRSSSIRNQESYGLFLLQFFIQQRSDSGEYDSLEVMAHCKPVITPDSAKLYGVHLPLSTISESRIVRPRLIPGGTLASPAAGTK